MPAPLSGITVIEAANYVAAPSAGALMADLGATVIKIEPPGGEVMRGVIPTGAPGNMPFNFLFELENRGKKSVTIALDSEGGPELLLRLLETADVFLTNLMMPRLQRFGLTPESCLARNPRLVFVAVTGYGLEGPDATRPGFDFSAFWTRSGIMSLVGHPGAPPCPQPHRPGRPYDRHQRRRRHARGPAPARPHGRGPGRRHLPPADRRLHHRHRLLPHPRRRRAAEDLRPDRAG
ncbi:MAG: CoA transferase [Dehalococcoidia bacterium]|nr:CoA transferase [Dehalococcoidia bacterium]